MTFVVFLTLVEIVLIVCFFFIPEEKKVHFLFKPEEKKSAELLFFTTRNYMRVSFTPSIFSFHNKLTTVV